LLWNFIIPFDVHILAEDAVIFTLLSVLFLNLMLTSSIVERGARGAGRDEQIVLGGAVLLTGFLAYSGFVDEIDLTKQALPIELWGRSLLGHTA
jgi:hypothetical protein